MRYLCKIIVIVSLFAYADLLAFAYPTFSSKNIFLSAQLIKYNEDVGYVEAIGDVVIISDGYIMTSNSLLYDVQNNELYGLGNITIQDNNKIIVGDSIFLNQKLKKMIIPRFAMLFQNGTIINAALASQIDKNHSILTSTKYTPCKFCDGDKPLWDISARNVYIDLEKEKVTYKGAVFRVKGVPIFYTPHFSHPTPNAKAQSGILTPSMISGAVRVPIYYRYKPNADFTFTPRFSDKYLIYETETRYITKNGAYNIRTSALNSYVIEKNTSGELIKRDKLYRYYINANGDFVEGNNKYGFKINRTSDNAYLNKYYKIRSPYLTSKIYGEHVNKSNVTVLESVMFQGLRAGDRAKQDPMLLPSIRVKDVSDISDDGNTYLTLENNTIGYYEQENKSVLRSANTISLSHILRTNNGHIIKLEGYNRGDIYHVTNYQLDHRYYLTRNTPEFRADWRYPLIQTQTSNKQWFIEPRAMLACGINSPNKNRKYALIDSSYYAIRYSNLFIPNKYNGIDYHEYGSRLGYGMNSIVNFNNGYSLDGFVGKLSYLNNNRSDVSHATTLGKAAMTIDDKYRVYYNAYVDNKLVPIEQEWGVSGVINKLTGNFVLVSFKPLLYYNLTNQINKKTPKIRQSHINLIYKIDDIWSVGSDIIFDIQSNRMLYRSMGVTYKGDCASIETRVSDDYTTDPMRGLSKSKGYSVSVGLKTINM